MDPKSTIIILMQELVFQACVKEMNEQSELIPCIIIIVIMDS